MKCSPYMNTNNTPDHRNCIPSPPTFAGSVGGNFHVFPWLGDYYLYLLEYIPYMGNHKVKAGQLTWCEGHG